MVTWKKDYLDVLLVPSGLLLMFGYHLVLLYRYLKCPQTTVIGYENHNKKAWVERMFQVDVKDRGPAISVISSNITAATALSSISLVLSSIIGAWIGSSTTNIFTSSYIYGSRQSAIVFIKYISLLSCFLVAFACFVQTARYFVHANFLISMPNNDIPVNCVVKEVIKGGNFWLIGLRSLYFATNLLLWIFGPIPMFLCSVIMVGVLLNLDRNTTPLHQYKPVERHELGSNNHHSKAAEAVKAVEQHLRAHEHCVL
ncbi:hypothetical protein BUALT_Bualt03G0141400 [Buddleja alternifolia]|uniref:DUF599 domain-containing protein n=1 Tax=Buddleja alternifolia TaxID=168488 RepID=A0AAV6XTM9_9LAMI|nr:hypothetical protein BUALT_Bualt03G0141400 [Buddleja alternifolia]